jgi:hypothetical protein
VAGEDTHAPGLGFGLDLLDEAGLPDPGLAADEDQTPTSIQGQLHGPPQLGALVVTVDKRGPGRAGDRSRRQAAGLTPAHLVQPPAFGETLEPEQTAIGEPDRRLLGAQLPYQIRGQDLTAGASDMIRAAACTTCPWIVPSRSVVSPWWSPIRTRT